MIRSALRVTVALATLAMSSVPVFTPFLDSATAGTLFSRAEVDQTKLVAVASPYANGTAHQLLIIEQIASSRPCWSESSSGSGLTTIDPLLGTFDFTGICGRSTDSNGYSIRMGDQDLGLKYSLRVVKRNGDLMLIGAPTDRTAPELQIGHANGFTNGFAKLYLNPGWRMTRRVYNGQAIGHIYLTNDQPAASIVAVGPSQPTLPGLKPPGSSLPISNLPTSKPSASSIPISVPAPTSPIAQPVPVPQPSTSVPIFVPRPGGSVAAVTQPVSSTTLPSTGVPIRVPLPSTVTRPTVDVAGAITSPSAVKPDPVINTPHPAIAKPVTAKPTINAGDYVVPTIKVYR